MGRYTNLSYIYLLTYLLTYLLILWLYAGDLFILVYSIDSQESFEGVKRVLIEIYEAKGQRSGIGVPAARAGSAVDSATGIGASELPLIRRPRGKQCSPVVVVGNKCDRELHRVVTPGELQDLVATLPQCVGLESSAKKNFNIEEIFVQLFVLARLPAEMSPSQHRRVPITYVGGGSAKIKKGVSLDGEPAASSRPGRVGTSLLRRQMSDACGAVAPNVRRPSIRTDLLLLQTRSRTSAAVAGGLGSFRGVSGSDKQINLIRKDSGRCIIQ